MFIENLRESWFDVGDWFYGIGYKITHRWNLPWNVFAGVCGFVSFCLLLLSAGDNPDPNKAIAYLMTILPWDCLSLFLFHVTYRIYNASKD